MRAFHFKHWDFYLALLRLSGLVCCWTVHALVLDNAWMFKLLEMSNWIILKLQIKMGKAVSGSQAHSRGCVCHTAAFLYILFSASDYDCVKWNLKYWKHFCLCVQGEAMSNVKGNLFTFWLRVLFVLHENEFMKFISMHRKAKQPAAIYKGTSFLFQPLWYII